MSAARRWQLEPREADLAVAAAARLDAEIGVLAHSAPWAAHTWHARLPPPRSSGAPPTLHVDDFSAIPFLQGIVGVEFYQLRARVRAGHGDMYGATVLEDPSYAAYCRDRLGFGDPAFIHAEPVHTPSQVCLALRRGDAFRAICARTQAAGGLYIHPYMGSEPAWQLAWDVAAQTGEPVHILGPPPPAVWFANDKAHLTRVAREVCDDGLLGDSPVVETLTADDPATMSANLRRLAVRHERVALKMTRCASAMGNHVMDAGAVRALSNAALADEVDRFLVDKEWRGGQVVLAVAWERCSSSPSTQLWIPPRGQGQPQVDGVYEQLLEGAEQIFLGSVPSRLDPASEDAMARASLRIARVYQELGYVGRCSFDFILTAGGPRFVECNGRWGGTSTPMHLVDRLFPAGRPAYRARDYIDPALVGVSVGELLLRLGDEVYDAATGRGRYIVYNTGCLAPYGKLDVIALGEDLEDATRALEDRLPRLL